MLAEMMPQFCCAAVRADAEFGLASDSVIGGPPF